MRVNKRQKKADEIKIFNVGDFVEEAQDGAATGGQGRWDWILERVKEHWRPPSDWWNKDQDRIPCEELNGIILPTRRSCLYRVRESLETGLTAEN